jgi:hypothetical protein
MFHPVGSQPPTVYWRRRLVALASIVVLLVLLVLTIKIATSSGDGAAKASPTTSLPTPHTTSASTQHTSTAPTSSSPHSPASSSKSSTPPSPCTATSLAVTAVVGKTGYQVGDQPLLELQVTNAGTKPCVQDLADRQVELRVYNGESRVWGSHDCKIQPGTDDRTLAPNMPVRVAITWSGLSSQPGCAGTRQRVGAGTYTLYAALSGKTGKATQFTIS